MATTTKILLEEGYDSSDELIRDWMLMVALAKVEQYQAECEFFTGKYKMTLAAFEKALHQQRGQENFEQEEDLDDWLFAENALKWWQNKVKELGHAANA